MTNGKETRELHTEIVEELWCWGMDTTTASHMASGILRGPKVGALIKDATSWRTDELSATQPFGEPLETS